MRDKILIMFSVLFLWGSVVSSAYADSPNIFSKGAFSSGSKLSNKHLKQYGRTYFRTIDQDRYVARHWLGAGDSLVFKIRVRKNNKIYRDLFVRSTLITIPASMDSTLSPNSNFSGGNSPFCYGDNNRNDSVAICKVRVERILKNDYLYLKIRNISVYTAQFGQEIYRSNPRDTTPPPPPPPPTPVKSTPDFNAQFYLSRYSDLRRAFGSNQQKALNHWKRYGIREGRRASLEFDVKYYLSQYGDLRRAFGTNYSKALRHWKTYGIREGRKSSRDFNVKYYLNRYGDLRRAFGKNYTRALNHWLNHGKREGRKGAP